MNWPAVAALSKDTPVVIPVAALEQHGHHLPLFTDSMLVGEIVRRAERAVAERALFTPVLWLGNSEHHLDFAGTMSARPRTYIDLVNDVVENWLAHGFRRIVIVNGHGGNNVPGQQAIFEVRQRHRQRDDLLLLFACYWSLTDKPPAATATFAQQAMGHACEWETSMILALAPHLVGDYKSAAPVEPGQPFDPVHRAWTTRDRSERGHIGHPSAATSHKGEQLLAAFSHDLIDLLHRVIAWKGPPGRTTSEWSV